MTRALVIALAVASIVTVPAARSAERLLTLDATACQVRFRLGATLHTVEGTVRVVSGEIRFDPAGGPAGGEIVLDATSADTGHPGRDEDMHRKVLESDRFARFVLRPTETSGVLEPTGPSRIELAGRLEIHGGVHEVSLPADLTVDGDRVSGAASFEVPYVAWGMKNPSKLVLRVKKIVQVEVALVGTLSPAPDSADR